MSKHQRWTPLFLDIAIIALPLGITKTSIPIAVMLSLLCLTIIAVSGYSYVLLLRQLWNSEKKRDYYYAAFSLISVAFSAGLAIVAAIFPNLVSLALGGFLLILWLILGLIASLLLLLPMAIFLSICSE